MSAEGATALFERVKSDEQFRAQLEAAETPEAKRRIVTDAGYDVSSDDLSTIRNIAGMSDLSDEDLEKVAGGIFPPGGTLPGGVDPRYAVMLAAVY